MSVKDIVLAASGQSTTPPAATFQIERSLRFNSADSAYLSRTPSVAGNRRTWTWSGWVKRSAITNVSAVLFGTGDTSNNYSAQIRFNTSNQLEVFDYVGVGGPLFQMNLVTNQVFRDPSAWGNVVVAVDTTQATSTNRVKIYWNGTQITSFGTATYPTQNLETFVNSTVAHGVGRGGTFNGTYLDGYLTEVNFIDGQALDPTSFGETDSTTGVWSPKQYTGTYGTNGFYLPFNDNSSVLNLGRNRIPFEKDPDWQQTVLLLSGDGNQGANNINNPGPPRYLAFTDNSNNNFPITVNGDAYGDNFSPFSSTDGNWSVYFGGTGNYIRPPSNAAFSMGTGDFTIEAWINIPNYSAGMLFDFRASSGFEALAFYLVDGRLSCWTGSNQVGNTGSPVTVNVWNHIAFVRSSGTVKAYLNGVEQWSVAIGSNISNNTLTIASSFDNTGAFNGYMSNVRLVKGTAVYTAAFTPSTTPLTAISGTSILTCQSNRFVDNSSNNFAVTTYGSVTQIKPTNPFTTTFDATAGSGYFDGNGDFLQLSNNATFDFNGQFLIDGWAYRTSGGSVQTIAGKWALFQEAWLIRLETDNTLKFWFENTSVTTTATVPINSWFHFAISRDSNNDIRVFLNGVQSGPTTNNSINITNASPLYVGAYDSTGSVTAFFPGWISNLRVVKGVGVSSIAVPTSPATSDSNTSLLTCQHQGSVRNVGFIDSSPYDNVINRTGNTTQGTFSPFSAEAGKWSVYSSDINGNIVNFPTTGDWTFSGDFTIESWVYFESNSSPDQSLYVQTNSSVNQYLAINIQMSNGNYNIYLNSPTPVSSFAHGIVAGQWAHVAMVRSGSTVTLYTNGVSRGTITNSATLGYNPPGVNRAGGGGGAGAGARYTSNFRIVRGTAIVPPSGGPTTPATAVTNTILLTHQSNRFVDSNTQLAAKAITVSGTPRVTPFSPFAPSAAYSPSVNGGSAYFDGTGDSLSVATNTSVSTGSDNFTLEAWVWTNAIPTGILFDFRSTAYGSPAFYTNNTGQLRVWDGNGEIGGTGTAVSLGAWNHIAFVRSGNTLYAYLNGVQQWSSAFSPNMSYNALRIGAQFDSTGGFSGYMSGVRLVKGETLYTTTFTPPIAPSTPTPNTGLLLNFTNAGIFDQTGKNVLETVGNAQVDTSVKKFGTGSMKFDGTGDTLIIPPSPTTTVGTGDFTLEAWIYLSGNPENSMVYSNGSWAANKWALHTNHGSQVNKLSFWVNNINSFAATLFSTTTLSTGVWYHAAVTRTGNTFRLFVNGALESSATSSASLDGGVESLNYVGSNGTLASTYFNGYIDDLRISRVAKYTGNFSVPDAPFALTTVDNNYRQWVPTNFSVTPGAGNDSLVDSPTPYGTDTGVGGEVRGNYATLNSVIPPPASTTYSNGNLQATGNVYYVYGQSTIGVRSGKWYAEAVFTVKNSSLLAIGISSTIGISNSVTTTGSSCGYFTDGRKGVDGTLTSYGASYGANDLIGVAMDLDAGTVTFYKNGVSQGAISYTFVSPNNYFYVTDGGSSFSSGDTVVWNFGQRPFAYTAPSGFKALCTTNLPNPAVVQGDDHFNTVLYTGNGTSQNVTGYDFQPDLIWFKARSGISRHHALFDAVRGANQGLCPSLNIAENTWSGNSFLSNGFTVDATFSSETNASGVSFVGWGWKANGAGVSNTAGSITSTVSANATAGISVVTYAAQSSGSATVGHGLGVAPSMIIVKSRASAYDWAVYHSALGNTAAIRLNTTGAANTSSTWWNNTSPTSSVFSVGSAYAGAGNTVAYCFAAVPGFSAFGSYTGNGSADGPFVYLGFRPAFVLIKNASTTGTYWPLVDTKRESFNVTDSLLFPNVFDAETTNVLYSADILSNGLKVRNANNSHNTSGNTYIYAAFAENPFKHSLAR